MLEIHVVSGEIVVQSPGGSAGEHQRGDRVGQMRLVEVRLQGQIRLLRQIMRPSTEDIVAAVMGSAAGLHLLAAAVEVAL